jgi:hypothetical protein
MSKGIDHDLFARLMRLSARERSDILEFLGQSAVSADHLLRTAMPADRALRDVEGSSLPPARETPR